MNELVELQKQAVEKSLQPLLGGVVTWVGTSIDSDSALGVTADDVWPTLQVRTPDGLIQVEVSRDPEGNGPGHLFIGAAMTEERSNG